MGDEIEAAAIRLAFVAIAPMVIPTYVRVRLAGRRWHVHAFAWLSWLALLAALTALAYFYLVLHRLTTW